MRIVFAEFRSFLAERVLAWLLPMIVVFGTLVWLAWKQHAAPASPFTYEVY
ncbi:MAG: DUF5989 family protein [Planctomycetota bacterium]